MVDSTRAAKSTIYQGIAFWVNGRLVGSPSWVVGSEAVIDGRARFAKRYSIVVKTDDGWTAEVEPDWGRFKAGPKTEALFGAVRHYAQAVFGKLSTNLVEESSEEALVRNREEFKGLSQLGRIEVASFAREFVKANPTVHPETLSAAVQALINLEKSRGGAGLLEKLTKLDDTDIEGLDRLLSQWTVRDALPVLDEIDHRLAVVTAIEKLCGDPATDELHTLHPLVTQARWLFGPEFDSSEYASNVSLRTATDKIFGKRVTTAAFANSRRRPDIVVLADATCSVVGTETFDSANSNLMRIQDVLIIELKKGKSAIGRKDYRGRQLHPRLLGQRRIGWHAHVHGVRCWLRDCPEDLPGEGDQGGGRPPRKGDRNDLRATHAVSASAAVSPQGAYSRSLRGFIGSGPVGPSHADGQPGRPCPFTNEPCSARQP